MKSKILWATVVLTFCSNSIPALAEDPQLLTMIRQLQSQMHEMRQTIERQDEKIRALEKRGPQIQMVPAAPGSEKNAAMSEYEFGRMLDNATGGAQKWLKDLKFSGDMRLRYDGQHYNSGSSSESDDRNRFRFRLRYGFEKIFSENMKVGFGLASSEQTGGANVDPTAMNQTFTGLFNYKPIFIEKAYATYTPSLLKNKGPLNQTEVTAGKFVNPFEKGSSDMVWDRDVRLEGVAEKFDFKLMDSDTFKLNSYVTSGQFVLQESATKGSDAQLFAEQLGINPVIDTPWLDRPVDFLQAFSFYDFNNFARKNNFTISGTSLARGNANFDGLTTELDSGKFKIIESYSELAIFPWGIPTRFHLDLAGNPSDGSVTLVGQDFAYGYGVKLGSIVKKGDWELGFQHKYLAADSVVGAFADSDFGDGFAGKHGNVFRGSYALTDNLNLSLAAYFVNNLNPNSFTIINQEQKRYQVDLVWKF